MEVVTPTTANDLPTQSRIATMALSMREIAAPALGFQTRSLHTPPLPLKRHLDYICYLALT